MAIEQTLSLVKPDGVRKQLVGAIYERFYDAGLTIVAAKMLHLSQAQAEAFYAVHKDKPFYNNLVQYMTSGPIFAQVLQGDDAISINRRIMGATDPRQADPGTIRALFADSLEHNVVHGSDAPQTAAEEVRFFFEPDELHLH
ncbi:MAG: nucleoside-diphosphate kinase [Pseudomonadota bacterium]